MSEKVLIWLLFEEEGAYLLGRRKPDEEPFAGYWTLPGDEMRVEESASETVKRFAQDELGIEVTAEEFVDTFYLNEGSDTFAVTVFKPASMVGKLRYRESGPYTEARWAKTTDLPMPIPEALAELLDGKRHWRSDEEAQPPGSNS